MGITWLNIINLYCCVNMDFEMHGLAILHKLQKYKPFVGC
jgi:hypothetical protein